MLFGTFFSHGLAILFGSALGNFENTSFNYYLKLFTYISFLFFGIVGFIPKRKDSFSNDNKSSFLNKVLNYKFNFIFVIALSIIVGEIGDKTFLASLGLGLEYPNFKLSLILGSISGMVLSNSIAILFGRFLVNKLKGGIIEFLSNVIFIIFGLFGLFNILFFNIG